jgi:chemotaxis protein methyltransferase CheR
VYRQERLRGVPQALLRTYFLKGQSQASGHYRVKPDLQKMIVFRRLNLIQDAYPFRGMFDIIFCRNVMIYFDKPTQAALINRFYRYLEPGGYLFIGHSESLTGVETQFKFKQPTIYQKAK